MNYLLVGNGSTHNLAQASIKADSIIQINTCRHAANLPLEKTHHIFISNMGDKVSVPLCDAIAKQHALLSHASVAYLSSRTCGLNSSSGNWACVKPRCPVLA
jgi:hypothetical protein